MTGHVDRHGFLLIERLKLRPRNSLQRTQPFCHFGSLQSHRRFGFWMIGLIIAMLTTIQGFMLNDPPPARRWTRARKLPHSRGALLAVSTRLLRLAMHIGLSHSFFARSPVSVDAVHTYAIELTKLYVLAEGMRLGRMRYKEGLVF